MTAGRSTTPTPAEAAASPEPGRWPKVSVAIPTHARPALLRGAVQSILDQRYPGEIEVLVVFDRETPTRPDVEVPPRMEMRLLTNDRTPGPAGAYNVAALAATGEFLALCDDDDEWLPDKLRLQVEVLQRNPSALMATCGAYLGDGSAIHRQPVRIPAKEAMSLDDVLSTGRNALHSSTFIVRLHDMLNTVGLVDEVIPGSYGEDYDWLLRAAAAAPVLAVRQPLVRVRWQYSYYSDNWQIMIDGLKYLLEHRPELRGQRRLLAWAHGKMAFGYAAMGRRAESWHHVKRTIRLDPRQPRAYFAILVDWRLVRPQTVLRALHGRGRGI